MKKKALAYIVSILLVFTMVPMMAFASGSAASIGTDSYDTLQDAVDAAVDGDTVVLEASVTEDITVTGKSITLDLNGNTITNASGDTITVAIDASLTIEGDGTVDNVTNGKAALFNNGTVVLNGGTYTRSKEAGTYSPNSANGNSYYVIVNHGTMTANDGIEVDSTSGFSSMFENGYQTYTSGTERTGYVDGVNAAAPSLTINGGTYDGGLYTVKNDDNSVLVINDGTFINTVMATVLNWNIATINGGTYDSEKYAVMIAAGSSSINSGELTITGGTFTSEKYSIYQYGSTAVTVVITDGTFAAADTDVFGVYTSADITITGGTYSSDVSAYVDSYNTTSENADGTYSIVAGSDAVASLNGIGYESVQAAVNAAADGDTVVVLADTTENIVVNGTVTIDLYGSTITGYLYVYGDLTLEDSIGTGSVTSTTSAPVAIVYEDATLTLNGGSLVSTKYYGIYGNGGTIVVNDGTISSYYAAVASNNTTGDMNLTVNGGTLTAAYGPAIYMPTQLALTVTGGTINGGISARMGQITVTGGTIVAASDNLDDVADYYDYRGNVFTPDAIAVMAGTYTSDSGNDLTISITGGEIICENGVGSAVAIYDLGKVEQEASVEITGGTLTTNTADRSAYQVVTLEDLGVDNSAYGVYSDAVETAISGGTFSTEIAEEYCAEGFTPTQALDGTYTVYSDDDIVYVEAVDATAANEGNIAYYYNTVNGEYYDEDGNVITLADTIIEAEGWYLEIFGIAYYGVGAVPTYLQLLCDFSNLIQSILNWFSSLFAA
ncbi:MAG: carbohydrate-binding domain-containing protein [Clostridiales bacterium]|nr:carbohydrate-binding domain-containing protein [Clostridiales bacterium]